MFYICTYIYILYFHLKSKKTLNKYESFTFLSGHSVLAGWDRHLFLQCSGLWVSGYIKTCVSTTVLSVFWLLQCIGIWSCRLFRIHENMLTTVLSVLWIVMNRSTYRGVWLFLASLLCIVWLISEKNLAGMTEIIMHYPCITT